MASGEYGGQYPLQHVPLPDDPAPDLIEQLLFCVCQALEKFEVGFPTHLYWIRGQTDCSFNSVR
jgi:hypothetical protein